MIRDSLGGNWVYICGFTVIKPHGYKNLFGRHQNVLNLSDLFQRLIQRAPAGRVAEVSAAAFQMGGGFAVGNHQDLLGGHLLPGQHLPVPIRPLES